jgi:hypothetical protein
MANSTTNLDTISSSQAQKEVTANDALDALSPASVFGRRATTTAGLTWGYYGGTLLVDGTPTQVANGTVALSASTTNYVEATRAGVVSKNTTAFTPGSLALYSVVTGASTITSYTDYRLAGATAYGRAIKAMSDANYTLLAAEANCNSLEFTGTLTVQRNIVVPLGASKRTVYNNTTGGFGLQFIGASGTGIVVAAGKRAIFECDATNVVRLTADI